MCGLAGFVDLEGRIAEPQALLSAMAGSLRHRGPDDQGSWFDPERGVGLAHRRLAILDLSAEGHQPMASPSGRYVIVYNGEIYNYRALGRTLPAHPPLRGHSDTEVLLAAIEHRGLEHTLAQLVGMFAFALWDRHRQSLYLVRDRLGIKPLYYGYWDGALLFGSELKALRCDPGCPTEVHRGALASLLRYGYIPGEQSIHPGIQRLPPGSVLRFRPGVDEAPGTPRRYWCARQLAAAAIQNPFSGSPGEALDEFQRLLDEAVRSRMVADVPVGAFLSGGIDSSAVVATMQRHSSQPVRTFAIGDPQYRVDEAVYARQVAAHLGTEHTELYISGADAAALIPAMPRLYDEPFADSSQIPTYLVSRLAREQVVVSLSGDGGDELFGGYDRYFWTTGLWRRSGWLPGPLRKLSAGALQALPASVWSHLLRPLAPLLPAPHRDRVLGGKIHTLADLLRHESAEALYQRLVSLCEPGDLLPGNPDPGFDLVQDLADLPGKALMPRLMLVDLLRYLPDDILTKVDRASMGVGLEARVPMLDHRLVEFALRLPLSLKCRDGQRKWPLRQLLYRQLPRALVDRPKLGFAVAIDEWLRGPLRDWAQAQLDPVRLQNEGFFYTKPIQDRWREHVCGARNWSRLLWNVLMFQAWLEEQKARPRHGENTPPADIPRPVGVR